MTLEEAKKIIKSECYIADLLDLDRTQTVNIALDTLIEAAEETRWIPVSERLPKDHENVLIYLSSNQITIGLYNSHRLPFRDKPIGWGVDAQISVHNFCSDDVVAWMPLPQPYKAEGSDEE